jgi:hypothetical protein
MKLSRLIAELIRNSSVCHKPFTPEATTHLSDDFFLALESEIKERGAVNGKAFIIVGDFRFLSLSFPPVV